MNAHRAGKIVKLTTFQSVRRGNWRLQFSSTNYDSIMLLASSMSDKNNVFLKYFKDEESAVAFVDFLVMHDSYTPEGDVSH